MCAQGSGRKTMDLVNGSDRRVPPAFLAVGFGVVLLVAPASPGWGTSASDGSSSIEPHNSPKSGENPLDG